MIPAFQDNHLVPKITKCGDLHHPQKLAIFLETPPLISDHRFLYVIEYLLGVSTLKFDFVTFVQFQISLAGPPRLLRPPRPGPCPNFGFQ